MKKSRKKSSESLTAGDIAGKKFHLNGGTLGGDVIVTPCGDDSAPVLMRKVRPGQPMLEGEAEAPIGKLVQVDKDHVGFQLCEELAGGSGPAQVATEDYRTGWERIFGAREATGGAAN